MEEIQVCEGCGVPLAVSAECKWEENGVISSRTSRRARWVFIETDNFDPLFHGIEELIGAPIEHIVIASRCRETRKYMSRVLPQEYLRRIRVMLEGGEVSPEERRSLLDMSRTAALITFNLARVYGYGDVTLGRLWDTGDDRPWRTCVTRWPYSLPLEAGESLGSCEAFEDRDLWARYPRIGEDTYELEFYEADHPIELREKAKKKFYEFKPGDLVYERCPRCEIPVEVGRFEWDLDRGIISDPATGRRMALLGSFALDSIFDDLREELGEEISETIIEAQRKYIKRAWGGESWNRGEEDFRKMIALRGTGLLTDFSGDRQRVAVRIHNSCLPTFMVGRIQAMVEMAYRAESSTYAWEMHDDGDLTVTIIPVIPLSPRYSTLECLPRSSAISVLPSLAASNMGVFPESLRALASAPLSRRSRALPRSPVMAAMCSREVPLRSRALTSAPLSTRKAIIPACPSRVAMYSGVQPAVVRASTSAPASRRSAAISRLRLLTARCRGVLPSCSHALRSTPSFRSLRTFLVFPFLMAENNLSLMPRSGARLPSPVF